MSALPRGSTYKWCTQCEAPERLHLHGQCQMCKRFPRRFTVHVVAGLPLEDRHPDDPHHRRLLAVADSLHPSHALAYCTGCEWFLRWPLHDVDRLHTFAHQHLGQDHLTDLLDGRAVIDPDLHDGGYEYLRGRLRMSTP